MKFKRPVIDSTKVKCSACRAKFYAGKAKPVAAGAIGAEPEADPTALLDAAVTAPDPEAIAKKKKRIKLPDPNARKYPKWLIPLAVVGVLAVSLAGIYFGQSTPPLPDEKDAKVVEADLVRPRNKAALLRPTGPAVGTEAVLVDVTKARRPPELIGVWHFQDSAGGTIELAADGVVRVKAALFDDKPALDFTSTWFVMSSNGVSYELEFGPEPMRNTNHKVSFRLQSDGMLKMLKYANTADLSVTPRLFKKM